MILRESLLEHLISAALVSGENKFITEAEDTWATFSKVSSPTLQHPRKTSKKIHFEYIDVIRENPGLALI